MVYKPTFTYLGGPHPVSQKNKSEVHQIGGVITPVGINVFSSRIPRCDGTARTGRSGMWHPRVRPSPTHRRGTRSRRWDDVLRRNAPLVFGHLGNENCGVVASILELPYIYIHIYIYIHYGHQDHKDA